MLSDEDHQLALKVFRRFQKRPYHLNSIYTCHAIERRAEELEGPKSWLGVQRVKRAYAEFSKRDGMPHWWSRDALYRKERAQALQDFLTYLERTQ